MRATVSRRLLIVAVASVALLGVGVLPASAAEVVDQTQAISPFLPVGVGYRTVPTVDQVDLGSSFTAGLSGALSKIDVPVDSYSQTGPKLDAQVRVWHVDAITGLPTGPAMATQVIPEAALAPLASGGTISTTFITPATVTAGTKYGFTIGFVPASGTPDSTLQVSLGTGPAASKHALEISNGFPTIYAALGISFTTYVTASPSAPPAPTAPALAKTGFESQSYLAIAGELIGLSVIAFGISRTLRRRTA